MNTKFKSNGMVNMGNVFTKVLSDLIQVADQNLDNVHSLPLTNIYETETGFELELVLSGFNKDEIEVKIETNNLIVQTKKEFLEKDEIKYIKKENFSKNFKRVFQLSNNVSKDELSAKYEQGILKIELKKVKAETKQIEIL